MDEAIELLGFLLAILVGAVLLIGVPAYAIDRYSCHGFSEATGYETRYEGLQCYVKTETGFVPKAYVFGQAIEARVKAAD